MAKPLRRHPPRRKTTEENKIEKILKDNLSFTIQDNIPILTGVANAARAIEEFIKNKGRYMRACQICGRLCYGRLCRDCDHATKRRGSLEPTINQIKEETEEKLKNIKI